MSDLDLAAVRAFMAAVEEGQFGHAADVLGITQQGVSKRIAKLESQLGVRLFDRVPTGIAVTAAGMRVLPRARSLLSAADDMVAAARPEPRPLRVAIMGERHATWQSMRYYLDRHPEADIDIVPTTAFRSCRDAIIDARADAAFARPTGGPRALSSEIARTPAYVEPLHLLVGKDHPLAARQAVTPEQIVPYPMWVPGASVPSEWADFYREWSEFSGITVLTGRTPGGLPEREDDRITHRRPYGLEAAFDRVVASDTLVTCCGDGIRAPWHPHIRRLPIVDPTPAYPHALLWATANIHPALPHLIAYTQENYNSDIARDCWLPDADRSMFVAMPGT
ncbi:LysR family transcriptional regulator [Nocardia alni]|uniref:LysR family transcriptional regulator n=1 Tax=Nocardia alni TaxID=2815723 RepID=UPI001C21BE17|nr:LysR family transcriptional regulator [Nocardia alni]